MEQYNEVCVCEVCVWGRQDEARCGSGDARVIASMQSSGSQSACRGPYHVHERTVPPLPPPEHAHLNAASLTVRVKRSGSDSFMAASSPALMPSTCSACAGGGGGQGPLRCLPATPLTLNKP